MATNVYEREEKIEYDPSRPCHYYGWYITTSSDDITVTGFHSKKNREDFIKAIDAALKEVKSKASAEYVAALSFGSFEGDEFCDDLLKRELYEDDDGEVNNDDFESEKLEPICKAFNEKDDADRLEAIKSPAVAGNSTHYIQIVEGGTEIGLKGPYKIEAERDSVAKQLWQEELDQESDAIFRLDITDGMVSVSVFSNEEMGD